MFPTSSHHLHIGPPLLYHQKNVGMWRILSWADIEAIASCPSQLLKVTVRRIDPHHMTAVQRHTRRQGLVRSMTSAFQALYRLPENHSADVIACPPTKHCLNDLRVEYGIFLFVTVFVLRIIPSFMFTQIYPHYYLLHISSIWFTVTRTFIYLLLR